MIADVKASKVTFGNAEFTIKQPERSGWGVWVLGDYDTKGKAGAVVYYPNKGQVPNWFHRKMQELCFGFQWRKVK